MSVSELQDIMRRTIFVIKTISSLFVKDLSYLSFIKLITCFQ